MSRKQLTMVENSPAIILSPEVMEQLGLKIGDELELSVIDRKLIIQSAEEFEREEKIVEAAERIFARRRSAYEKLAEGAK